MGWQSIQIVGASACVIFILLQKIQKTAKCTFWYWLTDKMVVCIVCNLKNTEKRVTQPKPGSSSVCCSSAVCRDCRWKLAMCFEVLACCSRPVNLQCSFTWQHWQRACSGLPGTLVNHPGNEKQQQQCTRSTNSNNPLNTTVYALIRVHSTLKAQNSRTFQRLSSPYKHLICFQALSRVLNFLFKIQAFSRIFGRPYYRSSLWYSVSSVCLSVTFCTVAKPYVLAKNCLKERIGNQGQRVDFLGRRRISTSGFAYMATETAVFCLMYCGKMVHPSKKVSEGVNRKPG